MTKIRLAFFEYLLGYKKKLDKGSRAKSHRDLVFNVKDVGISPLSDRKLLKY